MFGDGLHVLQKTKTRQIRPDMRGYDRTGLQDGEHVHVSDDVYAGGTGLSSSLEVVNVVPPVHGWTAV